MRCSLVSEEEELKAYLAAAGTRPSLVIVEEGFPTGFLEEREIPYLVFTERSGGRDPYQMPMYRSMDRQIRQIRSFWKAESKPLKENPCRLFAFCSPVHGAGQSVSAFLMGLQLAEEYGTLLVNLERFSGLKNLLLMGEGGLSDLLYYTRVQGDPIRHLKELTEYCGSLAYLPPVRDEADLKEMQEQDWSFLLHQLKEEGEYRFILLDVGDGVYDCEVILQHCERVYVPLWEDRLSQNKYQEWQEALARKLGEDFLKRIRPYRLPPEKPAEWVDYRQLKMTPWGRSLKALAEAEL